MFHSLWNESQRETRGEGYVGLFSIGIPHLSIYLQQQLCMGQQWSQSTLSYSLTTDASCTKQNKEKGANEVVTVHPPPVSEQSQDMDNSLHPLLQQLERLPSIHPLQEDNSNEIRLIQETKQLADMTILKRFYSGNTVGLKGLFNTEQDKQPLSFHSSGLYQLASVKRAWVEAITDRQEELRKQTDAVLERSKQVQRQLETKADQLRRVSTGIRQVEKLLVTLCDCQELLTKSLELIGEIRARSSSFRSEPICSFREYLHIHAPEKSIDNDIKPESLH